MPDDGAKPRPTLLSAMRFYVRVLGYFMQDWPFVLLTIFFIILATLCALLQPFPLAILIDSLAGKQPSNHWAYRVIERVTPHSGGMVRQIIALAIITFVLRLLQELFTMGRTLANIRVGYSGLMRARCDLFNKLQQLSLAYYKSQPQGDAIYRLSQDVYGLQAILNVIVNAVTVSILTIGFLIASVVPTARFAQPVGALVLYPMIGLSGLFVPLASLPTGLRAVASVLPMTYAVSLLQGIWRGEGWIAHTGDVVGLLVAFLVCTAISARVFRWE